MTTVHTKPVAGSKWYLYGYAAAGNETSGDKRQKDMVKGKGLAADRTRELALFAVQMQI